MSATTTPDTATSTDPNYIPRGTVETELIFFVPPLDGSAPYTYVQSPPPGVPDKNYGHSLHRIQINDIRGEESKYTLDKDSFEILQSVPTETSYSTFDSDEEVKQVYYPEVEALLLKHLPTAHKIVIFDHTVRRQNRDGHRQPANRTHIDQTAKAGLERVKLHITNPEEAEKLLKGRYRIVNVWRPLNGPIQSSPLAFATATSVHPDDLVPVEHRYPNRTGEPMAVKYNPAQRWLYLSGMENDERLLLKCVDSLEGLSKGLPHTAFCDSKTPAGARPRESVEVRALVFG